MRTIKFRGQDINTKEWRYGNLLHNDDTFYIVPQNTDFGSDYYNCLTVSDNHEVDPTTVGQFTGLLDKNGKEIYEGDIITYSMPDIPIEDEAGEGDVTYVETVEFANGEFEVVDIPLYGVNQICVVTKTIHD